MCVCVCVCVCRCVDLETSNRRLGPIGSVQPQKKNTLAYTKFDLSAG